MPLPLQGDTTGLQYPREGLYDPSERASSGQAWLRHLSLEEPNIMTEDESGRPAVRSIAFPSPARNDDQYQSKTFIWVMKGKGRIVDFMRIHLANLPKFEGND
ncbi:hypothetical protein CEP51_003401 [Fusarium floridanum]|uniref:Uncharacterized protein n=1 Tax=Fusarium floridanum TaxID=1325733 RepID=A0A428S651_9HYPO|nr:hypothetical protein CEP51_003401 [Fusarium floridanum]